MVLEIGLERKKFKEKKQKKKQILFLSPVSAAMRPVTLSPFPRPARVTGPFFPPAQPAPLPSLLLLLTQRARMSATLFPFLPSSSRGRAGLELRPCLPSRFPRDLPWEVSFGPIRPRRHPPHPFPRPSDPVEALATIEADSDLGEPRTNPLGESRISSLFVRR